MKKTFTYIIVLEEDSTMGGYTATCPALPGVVSEGETVEDALDMVRDAIRGYVESLQKDGLPVPEEHRAVISPVHVEFSTA